VVTRNQALAAVLAAAFLLGAALFWPTRERQVKRAMKGVAAWISKDQDESALRMAQRASDAPRFFADPCKVSAEPYGVEGSFTPQDLSRYALGAWSRLAKLEVRFYDVHALLPERDRAEVTATVRISVRDEEGEPTEETHEVSCLLTRRDGRWLVEAVTLVQVLER
jgi:hypothetical protein